jgi:molecular chaperone HtpG
MMAVTLRRPHPRAAEGPVQQRFQVHLKGIIELLSHHLYSSPAVFVRELLQNATDAIRARAQIEPAFSGDVKISVRDGVIVFRDDGIGLREDEIHRFLATIGESSKREAIAERRADFIGQFGIGLLSCFMVADEILLRTRSLHDERTWEWRGRQDGTYDVREAPEPLAAAGTHVTLVLGDAARKEWTAERVGEMAAHYGAMLPFPIRIDGGSGEVHVNPEPMPWRAEGTPRERRDRLLEYGKSLFGQDAVDAIPLRSEAGGIEGVAYVLPFTPHFGARQKHRVYLKGMLLTESAETLLPDWAFFVRCIVNSAELRPTASREGFYEDETLSRARDELGSLLRRYLLQLAREKPTALQRLIGLHALSMKALALDDDDFFRLVAPWFQFETSVGVLKLEEILRLGGPVRYCPTLEGFQQIARVAAAQGLCVVNAAYTHDTPLLEKLGHLERELEVVPFSAQDLPQAFEELTVDERRRAHGIREAATSALRGFGCEVQVKKFLPADLPALYAGDEQAAFLRDLERAREGSDELFGSLLDGLGASLPSASPVLYLNLHNPVIVRLLDVHEPKLIRTLVEMLYVQSLLLAHRPLKSGEMALLNRGLKDLIVAITETQRGMLH